MNDDEWTVDIEVGQHTKELADRLTKQFTALPVRTKRRCKLVLEKGEQKLIHDNVKECARFVLVGSDGAVELENRATGQRWNAYSLARLKFVVDHTKPLHDLWLHNISQTEPATALLTLYDQ